MSNDDATFFGRRRHSSPPLIDAELLVTKKHFRYNLNYESWKSAVGARRAASIVSSGAKACLDESAKQRRAEESQRAYEKWLKSRPRRSVKVEPSSQEKNDRWRSRNWRHELHVNFRGEREKPLPTKKSDEKKAYFLKWRRFVNWKKWLRRKRLESKQEATKTETTSERRAAAALAEREKWRKHEWRRVQGLEGKLKTIVSDATNTTSRKEQKILLKREQGWIIA